MADMYEDGPDNPTPSKSKSDDKASETALLPTSFFPEKPEVGKECTIRVERVLDGQVSVSYSHSAEKEEVVEDDEEVAVEEPMSDLMA